MQRQVRDLRAKGLLVKKWTPDTYREMVDQGFVKNVWEGQPDVPVNHLARTVQAFRAAGDPENKGLAQSL